ncbi:PqqD family protein [Leifsonia sp. McL0607]|uniref:PqqD family protein n=1 Tax=Leifsonia sp. McL0607 TaxID=3415672 RepID=UPI003CE80EA5
MTDIADFRQFQLVGPSAEVWSRIDGFASDDEVVRAVLAFYPEHPDTAYAECVSLIETMTDIKLLVHQPGTGRGEPDDVDHPDRGGRVAQPAQKGTVL